MDVFSFMCFMFRSCELPIMIKIIDEGMPNGPLIFGYLVFGPGGTSVEGIARPMKLIVWRGPGARLGVQCKI
jgi:hypothetical protein